MDEFEKIRHRCFFGHKCRIIDRGLAICALTGRYCNIRNCPKLKKEEKMNGRKNVLYG